MYDENWQNIIRKKPYDIRSIGPPPKKEEETRWIKKAGELWNQLHRQHNLPIGDDEEKQHY